MDAHDALRTTLLAWHRPAARGLPWRTRPTPWGVLVSEVMTQQTQAERVAPRWEAWMRRFPTPAALAGAPRAEVIAAWHGLGYNRRAVRLQACAAALVARHDGEVPRDLAALLDLPGVGPYAARAVLAFGADEDAAPVDVDGARVLARAVAGAPLSREEAQRLADEVQPPGRAAAWAAAVMDLGATVCRARRPRCGDCPLQTRCAWAGSGADPAAAGAHRPRPQGRWDGSARQARGRLVAALREGPLPLAATLALLGDDADQRLRGLVADGLVEVVGGAARLPR